MPVTETTYFGDMEYAEESTICFPRGLPGLEEEKRFLPIEQLLSQPVVFLQSILRPSLCFITLPVAAVETDYRLELDSDDASLLGVEQFVPVPSPDVLALGIVSIEECAPANINLLSPLVIAIGRRIGVQAIQPEGRYSHRRALGGKAFPSCS